MFKKLSRRSFLRLSAVTAATFTIDWPKINAASAAIGPKKNHPTVVIGAGLGGLCAAAYLAREGFPVTVIEQHSIPGGYATSFDRAGGKFTFEVSLHGTAIKNTTTQRILKDLDIFDKLDLVLLPEAYRMKTPDHESSCPKKIRKRIFVSFPTFSRPKPTAYVALSRQCSTLMPKSGGGFTGALRGAAKTFEQIMTDLA